ncbi:hypothetical protein WN943_029210 [Citrus x changshan-huyou]
MLCSLENLQKHLASIMWYTVCWKRRTITHFFFPLYKREENFSDCSFMKERKIIVSMVSILSGVRVTRFQVLSGYWWRAFDHGKRFIFLLIKMLL